MSQKNRIDRRLRLERLEQRVVLSAQSWDLAADFAADFVDNLPQNNPNGVWTYLGTDGSTSSLVATNGTPSPPGPNTFGVGPGWADAGGVPSYARGGAFSLPSDAVAGHGPNRIIWTAPNDVDLGGVELTGMFTQTPFEPTRQMRLQVYKNNFGDPIIDVSADFDVQSTVLDLPTKQVSMQPGDTLTILVDGSGPQGDGIATFSAFNLLIQEIKLAGDFDANAVVDRGDYELWVDSFGQNVEAGTGADGNGDGVVDLADYTLWKDNEGSSLPTGGTPLTYTPAAIIVETTGVTLPDGSQMDISGSQTQGLQEAFDLSAEQGWAIFVLPGTYTLDAHLDIEELQLRTFRFEDVTLNFTSNVTDFGIRFDSTMLTDWYWSGGGINAPSATHGVLYQPRTPHPLDGPKFGTIGVVDSRFHWNMDITAGAHQVTMNTQSATINDISFHFQNVPQNQINFVGGGFYAGNIFAEARTDDPIPFDLFDTAGRVTVVPPPTDITVPFPATIFKPDGSTLDVTGTTSFGLQEAYDFAGANNLDVLVFGRGVRNVDPFSNLGLYNISAPVTIGDLDGGIYKAYAVTFNSGGSFDIFRLGDLVDTDFEITGQIVATQSSNGLVIRPDDVGVLDSSIRVQAVIGSNDAGDVAVRIDPSLKSIVNSQLILHEVNTGFFGIKIVNPSATTEFSNNLVRSLHTHATGWIGVQVGENGTNASRINNNTIEIRSNTDGIPSEAALQVWGHDNLLDLFAVNNGYNFGAKLEPSSSGNTLLLGAIQANTTFVDFGSNNTVIFQGSGASQADLLALDGMFANMHESGETSSATSGSLLTSDDRDSHNDELLILATALASLADEGDTNDATFQRVARETSTLGENLGDDISVDVGESKVATLVSVR